MRAWKAFLDAPVFAGEDDRTQTARVLNHVIWLMLSLLVIGAVLTPFIFIRKTLSLFLILSLSAILLSSRMLMRRGRIQLASATVLSGIWLAFTCLIVAGGGMHNINVVFFIALTVLAGLLMGSRAAVSMAALSTITGLGMALLGNIDHLPHPYFASTPLGNWAELTFALILTTSTMTLALRNRDNALNSARHQLAERTRVEEALKKNEAFLRMITENVGDAIRVFDLQTMRHVYASPSVVKLFGIPEQDYIGMPVGGNLDDDSRRHLSEIIEDELKHDAERDPRRSRFVEMREKNYKEGRYLWTENHATFMRDADGRPTSILTITRDITARKDAERALRESEELFTKLIATLPDMMVRLDLNGQILFINDFGYRMSGYTDADLIGQNMLSFIAPEDRGKAVRNSIRMLERRLGPQEYHLIMKDGRRLLFEVNGDVLRNEDGSPYGLVQICRDITERERAEQALRESEERLRAVFDSVQDFVFIKDRNGRYVLINRFFQKRFQVDPAVFLSRMDAEIPIFENREKTAGVIQDTDQRVLMGETVQYEMTHRICGTWITFDIIKTPIRDENGDIISICGLSRDVTDRKRMQEERLNLEERLRRAEKMEALGTLAGGVAHDLNNVLGVLVGYSELLLMEIPEKDRLRRHVSNILRSSERGAAIIQDLLTLARRGVSVAEVANLNDILSDYFETPEFERLKALHPEVTFRSALGENLLNVKGSPVHLSKTVMNLVSNATEAIPGRGEVTIRTENRYLDRPVREYDDIRGGEYAVLEVTDNGMGIAAGDLGKIFEPFYTKKVMGRSGTGLGLAVVWGTVKDHHGYIDVQSEEERGSTFTLYFPVSREEAAQAAEALSPAAYRGRGESILVVDDVQEQRELATSMLERLGYRVAAVSSGGEAMAYIKNGKADLMVLDMIMDPGMDGLETYRGVLQINPQQRAVIVSGFSETDRVRQAQDLGAGPYVRKPYLLEKIGLAVRRELDRT